MSYYPSAPSTQRNNKEDQLSSRYLNKEEQLNYRYPPVRNETTRNENYASSRQQRQQRQQFSSTTRTIPTINRQTLLQQQQISDLERKIDLILMHNEKLQSEKQRYRALYEEMKVEISQRAVQSNTARFITDENNQITIEKLRKELQLSAKSYEQRLNEAYESRKILKDEISTLSKIIEELNQQNKDLKLSIKEQSLKVESLSFQLKQEFIRQQAELQNRLRDEFLIREIELKNERKEVIEAYERQIEELRTLFDNEKEGLRKRHENEVETLREEFQEEKRVTLMQKEKEFDDEKQQISRNHREQIKRQQDKAIQYIKDNMDAVQSYDQQIKLQYEEEINRLKESLQNKKKVIDTLLTQRSSQESSQSVENPTITLEQPSWLPQLIAVKQQLQQMTQQYLQESQLLKLKLTQKFQIDVKSLKRIYEDKIELMALHNERVEEENSRLRNMYQKSLQSHIEAKKDFELEKGKLRNIIRKLGIELHGIQEEFKLNIEGIRDQNSAFSMTMMKSMIEVKQKANFYSQQNRKLRVAYEQHERQTKQEKRQANEKADYYESTYLKLKQKYNDVVNELKQKIEMIQQECEERESQLRDNLNKEHEMIHNVVEGLRKDLDQLSEENDQLKGKLNEAKGSFKDKDTEIADLRSIVSQLEADIERLKLDLSMAGVNDKNHTDTINQWKNHYETSLSQLQEEKSILAQKLTQRDEQLTQIIKKYKLLEEQLAKVVITLKKRSHIEKKVIELGLDNNLVKNMSEMFGREVEIEEGSGERRSRRE